MVTPLRPGAEVRRGPTHYRSETDLPKWVEVASLPGGKVQLSPQARATMFVLELEMRGGDGRPVFCVVSTSEHYASQAYKDALSRVGDIGNVSPASGIADAALISRFSKDAHESVERTEESSRMIKAATDLVAAALANGSSDIHIESREQGGAQIRMRINGQMTRYGDSWQHEFVVAMGRAMHFVAEANTKPKVFGEDCDFTMVLDVGGNQVQARVEVTPTFPKGMDIVMRIQTRNRLSALPTLDTLGMDAAHIEDIEEMLAAPSAMIVTVGITGSGKTTTLYTLMEALRVQSRIAGKDATKLITIENPPENEMDGVTQIPTDEENAKRVLRKVLRMDPDTLMYGEVRDAEAADLLSQSVLTGHKTLTSLHASDPFEALYRFAGLGIKSDVMGADGFFGGFIAQVLVPTLCPDCKQPYSPAHSAYSKGLHERIAKVIRPGDRVFVESGTGCGTCKGTGIARRTACVETLLLTPQMRDALREGRLSDVKGLWRASRDVHDRGSMRGRTRLEHAIKKMRQGVLSPHHIEKELGRLVRPGVDYD